jgi:hypothetical protein
MTGNLRFLMATLLAVVLWPVSFPTSAVDTVPRYQMQCQGGMGGVVEHCTPDYCSVWCQGKNGGWQCETGIFEGNLEALLACCECPKPTLYTTPCNDNADCPSSYRCRLPIESRTTKNLPPRVLSPKEPTYRGTCVPIEGGSGTTAPPPSGTIKYCRSEADCGRSEACIKGRCMAY